jgi:hypothetical protein
MHLPETVAPDQNFIAGCKQGAPPGATSTSGRRARYVQRTILPGMSFNIKTQKINAALVQTAYRWFPLGKQNRIGSACFS